MEQLKLEKFLEKPSKKIKKETIIKKEEKLSEVIKKEKQQPKTVTPKEKQNVEETENNQHIILVENNLPPSYLIDVKYDGEREQAYLKLFNPKDGKVYRFYDKTEHKPYLYTTQSITEVENLLAGKEEYIGSEKVEKYDLLREKKVTLTKVLASNPLAIGGKGKSFRELISPAYEANIRYHLNYIYDNALIPGLLYEIKDGKLIQIEPEIEEEIKESITAIFKEQPHEVKELVETYLPTFFSAIPTLKRCSIDIEIKSSKGRIPDPKTAKDPIISVGFADTDQNVWVYVLNEKQQPISLNNSSIVVKEFTSEKEMIEAVFQKLANYPAIITFNGDNFDLPYLNKRARNIGIDESKNPIIQTTSIQNDTYLEYGLHIDLYRFFRQASMRIYAFGGKYDRVTLDELGTTLLNKPKVKLKKDIWDLELEELIEYNAQDALITLELTTFNQNQVMEIIFMLSRITKMPIDDFIRSSVSIWIQNWLYYEHRQRNYLIPRKEDILQLKGDISTEAIIKGKKYQGAIVIQPQAGVWWDVHVLDFASLYPSIIKTRNLSYETMKCNHPECKQNNKIPETNHWVCTKKVGIISMLIGFIRDVRVYWFKNKVKDPNLSEREKNMNNVIQSSLKVLINASYGVLGSDNFALYCPPVAESTTALAREAISKTKAYCEKKLGIPVIYGDSITGDTPLLLRKDGKITIRTIDDLTEHWKECGEKQIGNTDYEVWTDKGFTRINKIIRHKSIKKLFRVVTHTGVVDVTEDHSLLTNKGEKVKPSEISIGSTLLHHFPSEYPADDKIAISKEEAYVFGLFYADGSCESYDSTGEKRYTWTINNRDINLLEKVRKILCKIEKEENIEFKILDTMESSQVYKLVPHCKIKGKIREYIERYLELFYDKYKHKKVPDVILNAPRPLKQAFFEGYLAGDGNRKEFETTKNIRFSNKGKIGSLGLFYLIRALDYNVSVSVRSDKPEVYRITAIKSYQRKDPHSIKKIINLGEVDDYVYDLETENHHFHAGVGELIVHNTDSIFVHQPKPEDIEELKEWSFKTFQIELGTDYVFRYCGLSERKKNYFGITTKGKPIVKGLMGKKKNTPLLVKRAFDKVLQILTEVKSPEELEEAKSKIIRIVRQTMRRIEKRTFKIEDLAISVTLSKRLKEYESWTQPLQAAVQILIDNPNEEISSGHSITFVKTKPFKIKVPSNLINDKISSSDECSVKPIQLAQKTDIDVNKMKELVQSTFIQLFDTIGIAWNEVEGIKSLDNFFG
ncbi:MAG: DNA polymerase domain-containing protein [Candidatus Heimdallarchaeaceae archaeon]